MITDPIAGAGASAATAPSASARKISSDFQTFLEMLTVQMENQDPLNPIDSSDYAVQLATFSSVEQQVQTNDLLTALSAQMTTTGLADLSGWVGQEARTAAAGYFTGAPITIVPTPASVADTVELIVRNDRGTEVQRLPLPVSDEPIQWAGVQANGQPFAPGQYTFDVVSSANGEVIATSTAETYTLVREVFAQSGQVYVRLDGGTPVLASSVTAVRQPG